MIIKRYLHHRSICMVLALCLTLLLVGCTAKSQTAESQTAESQTADYGVFLSVTEDLSALRDYKTVVIDAQYFSGAEIEAFRADGHTVYSYLNVGSLENFRDYYATYAPLTLGAYEHWDEERWIDVADQRWQRFLTETLIPALLEKHIDGFFVDNCDVYAYAPTKDILEGLSTILHTLVGTGKAVLINGGDVYLDAYCASGGQWQDVLTGINQESVFTKILWDEDRFAAASPEDRDYFLDYIERYASQGAEIYLLEYTRDRRLIAEIQDYCQKNGFHFYISDSLELDEKSAPRKHL